LSIRLHNANPFQENGEKIFLAEALKTLLILESRHVCSETYKQIMHAASGVTIQTVKIKRFYEVDV
jgi:hypothetical protein